MAPKEDSVQETRQDNAAFSFLHRVSYLSKPRADSSSKDASRTCNDVASHVTCTKIEPHPCFKSQATHLSLKPLTCFEEQCHNTLHLACPVLREKGKPCASRPRFCRARIGTHECALKSFSSSSSFLLTVDFPFFFSQERRSMPAGGEFHLFDSCARSQRALAELGPPRARCDA